MSGFVFRPDDHTYWLNDKQLPGVTSTLKPLTDYDTIPKKILDAAAERGKRVHLATELHDYGTLDYGTISDEIWPYLNAYMKFLADKRPTIVGIEQQVYHPTLMYAGTYDREIIIDGKLGILDVKSTWQMQPATGPQTSAYLEAVNARRPSKKEHCKHRWGLQLKRDGGYELHKYGDPVDWSTFVSCLNVRRWLERNLKAVILTPENNEEAPNEQ